MECGQNGCGACCGGNCSGCGSILELTDSEFRLLRRFAEIPFLPVSQSQSSGLPILLEEDCGYPEETGAALMDLSQKGLIQIDYDIPLSNFDYADYASYSGQGSMALTARGQAVIDLLDIQGIEE